MHTFDNTRVNDILPDPRFLPLPTALNPLPPSFLTKKNPSKSHIPQISRPRPHLPARHSTHPFLLPPILPSKFIHHLLHELEFGCVECWQGKETSAHKSTVFANKCPISPSLFQDLIRYGRGVKYHRSERGAFLGVCVGWRWRWEGCMNKIEMRRVEN